MLRFRRKIAVIFIAGLATLSILAGTAFAASYETTNTLTHGSCTGYGWGNSAYGSGVYAGTTLSSGVGNCYRMQDAYFEYNSGSVYNPLSTGWQLYDLFQGAGPEGSCDVEVATHWISWSQGGASSGSTSADDGC